MQPTELKSLNEVTENLEREAERLQKALEIEEKVKAQEEDAIDEFTDSKVKIIPTPNFTECSPVGTFLPINMADETVTTLSILNREFDFVDFVKDKLGYQSRIKVCQSFASEQVDAIVLAIKSFEKNNAFILGDMAGIGKGRVCAAILRYAFQRGFIPMFITHKPYLFSDIYRDLTEIGGLGYNGDKIIDINPIVLHPDGTVYKKEIDPATGERKVAFAPLKNRELLTLLSSTTDKIERRGEIALPKPYNAVFLPYSTLSQSRDLTKQSFLEAIAPKCIIVFDESHNAASANTNAIVLKRSLPLVQNSEGVLFSSATYAKSPAVFNLYVVKTALRTAVPDLEQIADALKIGGENVSEYIASGLVKEGQMIRRERSFSNCKKVTEYVGTRLVTTADNKIEHIKDQNDNQKQFFNEAIGYFKRLRDFSKTLGARLSIKNAVHRKVEEMGYEIADMEGYIKIKQWRKAPRQTPEQAQQEYNRLKNDWIAENRRKYIVSYNQDSITRYKATFRENLFLAIKAKFAADKIIECLNTEAEYKNIDGTIKRTPQKPIIAIRNTGSAIFNELRLKEGDILNNDFSEYLKAIYNKLFNGEFTLRKVDSNIFETVKDLAARNVEPTIIEEEYQVILEDFSQDRIIKEDGTETSARQEIQDIQSSLNNYVSQLPFSVIDYLKYRIESTRRSSIYFNQDGTAKYGKADSEFYSMVEGTGRKEMLVKVDPEDPNSKYIFKFNDRPKSVTTVYEMFNNGGADVMLINVVASTGGSAQSNPREGVDVRQRNMFIIQFELDINTEIQKRGRVNRTGQVNSPVYTYIISQIPVELRTYLMFRKKLRKLDANTSADQTASSETAEITDQNGLTIQDIFNEYGFHVFSDDFIEQPQNSAYADIYSSLFLYSPFASGAAEKNEFNLEKFNAFVRELELYPSDFQEYFFDEMNSKYISYVENLKATGDFQLELTARDYKAALKQSVVIQMNSGTSIFSLPLFLSDYYTINDKKIWSKDKVTEKINELALGRNPLEYHRELIMEYRNSIDAENANIISSFRTNNMPKRDEYESDEDFETANIKYEGKLATLSNSLLFQKRQMTDLLLYFKPDMAVKYQGNYGKFLGYKIKSEGSYKFEKGSVEFHFCFLSAITKLNIKNTDKGKLELEAIQKETLDTTKGFMAQIYTDWTRFVAEWKPDLTKRTVKRFFTGNILSGVVEANRRQNQEDGPSWVLTRFTNIDGSITTAIEQKYSTGILDKLNINTRNESLMVSCGNPNFIEFLKNLPVTPDTNSAGRTIAIWNVSNDLILLAPDDSNRAISIMKTQIEIRGTYVPVINFAIMQPVIKDKETGQIKDLPETSTRINNVFYDDNLQEQFSQNLTVENFKEIKYARYEVTKVDDNRNTTVQIKKEKYNVRIKKFSFNLNSENELNILNSFSQYLANQYQLSFNFRAEAAAYLNTPVFADPFDATKKYEEVKLFEEGDYEYRFIRKPNEEFLNQIPNLKSRKITSAYGEVITKYPLTPIQCKSFELIPVNIPAEVIVKMTLFPLSDADKVIFTQELEKLAPTSSSAQIGAFVSMFLSKRTVGTDYFFGDMSMPQYGNIFKEYALKTDLKTLINEEKKVEKEVKVKKSVVTFDDAERFLMFLNP